MGNSHTKTDKKQVPTNQKALVPAVKPPRQFMTRSEFLEIWPTWKADFLEFKQMVNKIEHGKKNWGNMLLNLMGPIGQGIYSTFMFNSLGERENVDVLLKKFDECYIFLLRKRLPQENIYEYINDLQSIMKNKNIENADKLIKQKISTEVDKYQFTNAATTILPTFTFSSNFNSLTLKEIAFIWRLYDNGNLANVCPRCGSNHGLSKCPAMGKQCLKCNEWNHFKKRCPLIFIHDCKFCGGTHFNKQCPAFNEICTKCQRLNHFSWKCQCGRILSCRFCGLSHSATRSVCPAKNSYCTNCKMTGHFISKCNKKSHPHKY